MGMSLLKNELGWSVLPMGASPSALCPPVNDLWAPRWLGNSCDHNRQHIQTGTAWTGASLSFTGGVDDPSKLGLGRLKPPRPGPSMVPQAPFVHVLGH